MLKAGKPAVVKELKEMISSHSAVGIVNMHKMPTRSLQAMRESLRGKARIKMAKKTLLVMALQEGGLSEMAQRLDGEPALLLSNENPFRLYRILKESRTPAAAKAGDIAPNDIMIQKGSTGLPPGPAISMLQKAGLKTAVEGGKISVAADKIVLKKGEAFNSELAGVLSMLKMEPMEIGMNLLAVIEDGFIYEKSVLDIDVDSYIRGIEAAIRQSFNLSLNTGYVTMETAPFALQKAFIEAKTLAIEAGVLSKDIIGEILMRAVREAKALESVK